MFWQDSCVMFNTTFIIYLCRLYLAALHWNENADRSQATKADGSPMYRVTYQKAKEGRHTVISVLIACTFGMFHYLLWVDFHFPFHYLQHWTKIEDGNEGAGVKLISLPNRTTATSVLVDGRKLAQGQIVRTLRKRRGHGCCQWCNNKIRTSLLKVPHSHWITGRWRNINHDNWHGWKWGWDSPHYSKDIADWLARIHSDRARNPSKH